MTKKVVLLLLVFACSPLVFGVRVLDGTSVSDHCGQEFQKVTDCLSFATGKDSKPSKDCCDSVKELKDSDPKCLCFIMQQTHNGSSNFKSLHIQEAKLLQLPSACQLQNASLSECPKLLGLSPSSPDAAIFTNASTTPAAPATTTGTPAADTASITTKHGPPFATLLVISVALSAYVFPAGFAYI